MIGRTLTIARDGWREMQALFLGSEVDTRDRLVRAAIDEAIAQTASSEYDRLSYARSRDEQRRRVNGALESMQELQRGGSPDYGDPWVALLYLTWYLPRQIHLAYAVLRPYVDDHPAAGVVLDYGCGPNAVRIALAILTSEMTDRKAKLAEFAVHGIDINSPMTRIGELLWERLCRTIEGRCRRRRAIRPLRDALRRMTDVCGSHDSWDAYTQSPARSRASSASGGYWVTAMHVVDERNNRDLKHALERIRRETAPEIEFVTTHRSKSSQVEFFGEVPGSVQNVWPREKLEMTTEWRQKVRGLFGYRGILVDSYLARDVTWDIKDSLVWVRMGAWR